MTTGTTKPRLLPVVHTPSPRAIWHRKVAWLPLGYLAAVAVLSLGHRQVAESWWLMVHLLLLGAVTNAILVWSAHFAAALLRRGPGTDHRAQTWRLVLLNAGVIGVLAGGSLASPWVGVAGGCLVFAAVTAHLVALAGDLRRALPARFTVTVHYYLAAGVCLLLGIPAGATMLLREDARILLFHQHVNLLGWVTLTVLGTLLTFWPTVLRTKMADGAREASVRGLPICLAGIAGVGAGVLAWWPWLAVAGLVAVAGSVLLLLGPAVAAARRSPPSSFAAWSLAAGVGWLLISIGLDGAQLAKAGLAGAGGGGGAEAAADGFGALLVPLAGGFIAQVLLGSLSFLIPMVLGGGPEQVRRRLAVLDGGAARRVTTTNLALLVVLLPVSPYVHITVSLLLLAALVEFLVRAARLIIPVLR